jgi:5-(carboxyamino)imidazole ribonucleotide synthase
VYTGAVEAQRLSTALYNRRAMHDLGADPTTLGVVGGGQLGRMLAEAAAPLGVEVVVLDPTPDPPAAPVARDAMTADFDDADAVAALAERADALTFEIELADPDALERAAEEAGIPVQPSPDTLRVIGDKLVQKRHFADAGVPVPEFRPVDDADDLAAAVEELGPVMLKARSGGYDGRGNVPVEPGDDYREKLRAIGDRPAMAERFVEFDRELAVVGAVGADGQATFPVTETVHREEILRATGAPARTGDFVRERAREVAGDVLDALSGRGVFGVELFETGDGEVLLNEVAPRPHNSGHWTIEGATTSQFEQHVRAVLGAPLGDPGSRDPTVTVNVLGTGRGSRQADLDGASEVLATAGAHLHWYGKREVRPLRKMGHVTCTSIDGEGVEALLHRGRTLVDGLSFAPE